MYKLMQIGTSIIKLEDGIAVCHIPADPSNADYLEYLSWVAEGNSPEPADAE